MPGPGEYLADRTEGITRVEDLPKAKVVQRSRNYSSRPCPQCERSCYRHRTLGRTLHDLGDLVGERPRDVLLTYSQHYCCKCQRYFNVDMSDLAPPKSHYDPQAVGPQMWLTLIWHIGLRLPWCWKIGPSYSSERAHLLEMLAEQKFPECRVCSIITGDCC